MPQDDTRPGALPRLAYRLLTGADDRAFCERISTALAEGYVLYGGPSVAVRGGSVVCAQAVVLPRVRDAATHGAGVGEGLEVAQVADGAGVADGEGRASR